MFLSLDGTAWIQLANFAIFFALLNVLFLKPVGAAMAKRREYISGLVKDYDAAQAEANALRADAERVRADARRDAETILAKARADASNEAARIATEYGAKVQATVEQAQRTAEGELAAARESEGRLVEQLAGASVDRAVGGGNR